jgi:transposase
MNVLTEERVARQRTPYKKYSQDLKERFVSYIKSSPATSIASAARTFGIPISTAHFLLKRLEERGTLDSFKRGGARQRVMTPDAIIALSRFVDENPASTLHQLRDRLHSSKGILTTTQTISKVLTEKIKYTVKLLRAMPLSRNCPATIQSRKEYALHFLSNAPADRRQILWIDECGFNLHIRRKFGRAKIGMRASVTVANNRGTNISVSAAMNEEGLLYEQLRPGAYNAESFHTFLQNLFQLLSTRGQNNCWLVMDNVKFHHCDVVVNCARSHGHEIIFLPPYSPMLNPIESLFSKWKILIRTQGISMTRDQLLAKMATARFEITASDCLGWIRETNRNLALSTQEHAFE